MTQTIKKPEVLNKIKLSSQVHDAPFISPTIFSLFTSCEELKKRNENPNNRKYTVITGKRFDGVGFRASVYTSLPVDRFLNLPESPYYISFTQQWNGNWLVSFNYENILASKYAKLTRDDFNQYLVNLELRGAVSFISDPSNK